MESAAISRSRKFNFPAAFGLCLLLAVADSSLGADQNISIQVSPIAVAKLLIKAGQLDKAHGLLEKFKASSEEDEIERLFLLGMVEMQLGQARPAAARFEAILAKNPHLTRVRLELAQAYYLAGRFEQAQFHFESSLADGLPSSVESKVSSFLRRIDDRKQYSAYLSMAVLPSTNPAKRSGESTILVGGIPFKFGESTKKSSGTGSLLSAGISFAPPVTEFVRGHFAVSSSSRIYERSDWNDVAVATEFGLTRLFSRRSRSGGLGFSRRWLAGDGYSRRSGLWFRSQSQFSEKMQIGVSVKANVIRYDENPGRNGYEIKIIPDFRFLLDRRTASAIDLILETADAKDEHHSYRRIGLGWNWRRAFASGLTVSVNPFAAYSGYGAPDPLFGRKRIDRQLSLGLTLLHRSFNVRGFSPSIGFLYEKTSSSIPLHSFENFSLSFEMTREY